MKERNPNVHLIKKKFLRLEICHSELSQKCVLIDESGLQEDGRTFLTVCVPAVGHYHVVHLEEGAMY